MWRNTSSASSSRPFDNKNRGLSGNQDSAINAANSGIEQTIKNTRHGVKLNVESNMLMFNSCGSISHARPENFFITSFFNFIINK